MKSTKGSDIKVFEGSFSIENYIENLISGDSKFKNFGTDDSFAAEGIVKNEMRSLIQLLDQTRETNKNSGTNFKEMQNKFYARSSEIINDLQNINSDLSAFLLKIDDFKNVSNTFSKSIAIHDLAITRARYLIRLLSHFNRFAQKDPDVYVIPSNFDEILKSFETVQVLIRVAETIECNGDNEIKRAITNVYERLESCVKDEFIKAFENHEISRVKGILNVISGGKTQKNFYETFISHFQQASGSRNIFENQPAAFSKFSKICQETFPTEFNFLMNLYVQNLYNETLKMYCEANLNSDSPEFLECLFDLYGRCTSMQKHIADMNSNISLSTLEFHQKQLFSVFLDKYYEIELKFAEHAYNRILSDYQTHKNTSLQDAGLDMITIARKTHLRCIMLSSSIKSGANVSKLFELLIFYLINNLLSTEFEIFTRDMTANVVEIDVKLTFFEYIEQITNTTHLIGKFFKDYIVNSISSSPDLDRVSGILKRALFLLESKIDTSIAKFIMLAVSSIKTLLSHDIQEKMAVYGGSLMDQVRDVKMVCKNLKKFNSSIKIHLSEANYKSFGLELAVNFCRFLVQYYKEFTYTQEGAMILLWDIREYQSTFSCFNVRAINELFDLTYSLMNILIVPIEDILNIARGEGLNKIDPQLVQAYVERRKDYKSSNIGRVAR